MFKKVSILVFLLLALVGNSYAKTETDANVAGSQVIYGYSGSSIVPVKVNSSGYLVTSSTSVTVSRKESSQNLSSAAMNYTTNFSDKVRVRAIFVHASVAITETVKIYLDSLTNATYDTLLVSQGLTSQQDLFYLPEGGIILEDGDELNITVTNANATGTVYVTVMAETLN